MNVTAADQEQLNITVRRGDLVWAFNADNVYIQDSREVTAYYLNNASAEHLEDHMRTLPDEDLADLRNKLTRALQAAEDDMEARGMFTRTTKPASERSTR